MPQPHPVMPTESEHADDKPDMADIVRCSRLLPCHDLPYLAGTLDVPDQEMEQISHQFKNHTVQAQQLLKKWSAHINGSRRDLFNLLYSMGEEYYAAAQRYLYSLMQVVP